MRKRTFLAVVISLLLILNPATIFAGDIQVEDNELVVVNLNNDSEISAVQILNHLKLAGEGTVELEDQSQIPLKEIRELYGAAKLTQADGKIKLNTSVSGEKDLYYLATVEDPANVKEKLPVKITVEYYLDGSKVNPSELYGKSGHLKIVTTVENLTGREQTLEFTDKFGKKVTQKTTVYTPFVVSIKDWQFDNKIFKNVAAPGKAQESPQGVITDVKGITQVNWTMPLIPPKYPAKQYAILEADGTNIKLPSFDIAVIPILPVTSEVDTLAQVEKSLIEIHDGFNQIASGVGKNQKDGTLLYGFSSVLKAIGSKNQKDTVLYGLDQVFKGLTQVGDGLNKTYQNLLKVRFGLKNDKFNATTYDAARGRDAAGNAPGVYDALGLMASSLVYKLKPAVSAQNQALTGIRGVIGGGSDAGQMPSAATSIFNDLNTLKALNAGNAQMLQIIGAIDQKLGVVANNLNVLQNGGKMITSSGPVDFPASIKAVDGGLEQLTESLDKTQKGVEQIVEGIGNVKANGQPVPVIKDGQPGTLLYALTSLREGVENKLAPGVKKIANGLEKELIPGLKEMEAGVSKIGAGATEGKSGIEEGLVAFAQKDVLLQNMENSLQTYDTFLGKPSGAKSSAVFVFKTPAVNKAPTPYAQALSFIVITLVLIAILNRTSLTAAKTTSA